MIIIVIMCKFVYGTMESVKKDWKERHYKIVEKHEKMVKDNQQGQKIYI